MKRNPIVLIVVVMIVSVMIVVGIQMSKRPASQVAGAQMKGQPAPDFTLQTLEGKTVKLSDYRGKAVLLNFWATWCEPCKIEMPWFVDLQKQYAAAGLQVIGVSMDDDGPEAISKFVEEMKVNYLVLTGKQSDRDNVANLYGGVTFLPESFYIDRDGKIVEKAYGIKGRGEIEEAVKRVLAQERVALKQ